jgi:hypothetical protein
VKIYVAIVEALKKKEEGMKLSSAPQLVEKEVWVPVILFCTSSFPITCLMPYCAETGYFHQLIA